MKLFKTAVVLVLLGFLQLNVSAQIIDLPAEISEEQIHEEIIKRGLNEDEVKEVLLTNGFDIDDISTITAQDLPQIQQIIDNLVAQKEHEKINTEEPKEIIEPIIEIEKTDVPEKIIIEIPDIIEPVEKDIEIYGHQMFRNKEIHFYSNKDGIRAPDYYVLGIGDELAISIFGSSYFENTYIINSSGYIQILENQKRILLKGLSLEEARKKLKRVFAAYYIFSKSEFHVSLNYSRPVILSIYGEVMKPGAITLPAINNVFNALAAVEGPSNIGSVRKIQIIKKNGIRNTIDLFEYINNPSINKSFYLADNDMIIVPAAETIVKLSGAVNRPMKYELLIGEGISTLIKFAGGFTKQAYTKSIKVERIVNNQKTFIDIDFDNQKHFALINGDEVHVNEINTKLSNYVSINGEVISPGRYERKEGMRISDLVQKSGLKKETRSDLIYLKRISSDKSVSYKAIYLDKILEDPASNLNQILIDLDELILWPKDLFLRKGSVVVNGAVRVNQKIDLNGGIELLVKDALLMSGGLSLDASDRAMIYRQNSKNNNEIQYFNLFLDKGTESSDANFVLLANDSLHVFSKNDFIENATISITGAVNNPSSFQYGENMTLKDALLLALGTKNSAAKNRIEISRIIMKNNEPTQTVVANVEIDDDFNLIDNDGGFKLEPYDNIFVRYVPDFELQQTILLVGEVKYPGKYAIINENETILDVVNRAGGLTREAFSEGASLFRSQNDIGYMIIRLEDIIEDRNNRFNFKIRNGDRIDIPKVNDFVTIAGATNIKSTIDEKLISNNQEVHVPFEKGKNALYYINEYVGGLAENADKRNISVQYPNGSIKNSKNFIVFRLYPKIETGSKIIVGYKSEKEKTKKAKKEDVDWNKIVSNTVAQVTSLMTLLLVTKNLNN